MGGGGGVATTWRRPVAAIPSASTTRSTPRARRSSARSAPSRPAVRILAIDHGAARAGCAISDPTGTIARPLGVIEPPDPQRIAEMAAEHDADLVVVGLPVSLDGAEGTQAAEARRFRDELEAIVDVPVETYDERLTTRLAESSARAGASAPADALAAAYLLETYLRHRARRRAGRVAMNDWSDPFAEKDAARERERRRAEREARGANAGRRPPAGCSRGPGQGNDGRLG